MTQFMFMLTHFMYLTNVTPTQSTIPRRDNFAAVARAGPISSNFTVCVLPRLTAPILLQSYVTKKFPVANLTPMVIYLNDF